MKIINELADSSIRYSRKDTLATKISIFLAVLILGTVIFIIDYTKSQEHNYIKSTIGDYQVSISGVDKKFFNSIVHNRDIEKLDFEKITDLKYNAVLSEKSSSFWKENKIESLSGRKPENSGEIIVPIEFLAKNPDFHIGSKIEIQNKNYMIVGKYNSRSYTFEEALFLGYLSDTSEKNLYGNSAGVSVYIWYKNPRDTYTLTNELLKNNGINPKVAESIGRLYYNTSILEYKMIYPSGILPPKKVIGKAIEKYSAYALLMLLFAVIIYGAFNVWNSRNMKEIALLKSIGMTDRQIVKMIMLKIIKLSYIPIAVGTAVSYFTANILLYLMWINNYMTYKNISAIYGLIPESQKFKIMPISVKSAVLLIALSFITVYISAIVPAVRSSGINIVDGLKGLNRKKTVPKSSSVKGMAVFTLAKDYFHAYRSTYRTINLTMIISALAVTVMLVSQSYRSLLDSYDSYKSPYSFSADIYSTKPVSQEIKKRINAVGGTKNLHIASYKDFMFLKRDNDGFLSQAVRDSINSGKKDEDRLFARVYGLSDSEFSKVAEENRLSDKSQYLLLNSTPKSNSSPYKFRDYVNITDRTKGKITIRYSTKDKPIVLDFDGSVNAVPFELDSHEKNGIYIFTKEKNLTSITEKFGNSTNDPTVSTIIRAETENDKTDTMLTDIISSHFSKSDYNVSTKAIKKAQNREQMRNEFILNTGIQIVLLIIALSNAYNSFHGNILSRKREFMLLTTVGMTEKQIEKMLISESLLLMRNAVISYLAVFAAVLSVRSYKSIFSFSFAFKNMLTSINYFPLLIIFSVMAIGIYLSVKSGIKMIFKEDMTTASREF